ncbi:MAG: ABC transporter ATP-binding protein [Dehalococcoidales bacterium]|nr:ABC transporter ATP-binding protein [Dehalococcoidales bacterium]
MNTAAVLEARQLSVVMGDKQVLEIPSFRVQTGETLAIIGPNGSGKTTLLLCLAILKKPTSGDISYHGDRIGGSAAELQLRRRFAVVFQEPLLLDTTVRKNVTLGLRLRGIKPKKADERAQEWLARFNIAALAERSARTLSGGEAQRTSLARALVLQPEVLFLDEPFANLDAPTRQTLLEDFARVLRETRITTVMVTHDRNEAMALADRVAVLIEGRLRQIGLPREVFSSPADEAVAGFVGVENVLPGMVAGQSGGIAEVEIEKQRIDAVSELPARSRVTACLHPEDITLTLTKSGDVSSARNHLTGAITRIFPIGSQVRVTIDCGFPLIALITRRSFEEMKLETGQMVVASFKASAVYLIDRH